MYTKQHFINQQNHQFSQFWEDYLDEMPENEKKALFTSLRNEGETPFDKWLKENAEQVDRYILATTKQRESKKAWQKHRYLYSYARWRILCKGLLAYEWLQQFDPPYLKMNEETLLQLADSTSRLFLAQSALPAFPSEIKQGETYPYWYSV
ncbi:hypothetical protein [Ursidibacter sp. B-7004-1]